MSVGYLLLLKHKSTAHVPQHVLLQEVTTNLIPALASRQKGQLGR